MWFQLVAFGSATSRCRLAWLACSGAPRGRQPVLANRVGVNILADTHPLWQPRMAPPPANPTIRRE